MSNSKEAYFKILLKREYYLNFVWQVKRMEIIATGISLGPYIQHRHFLFNLKPKTIHTFYLLMHREMIE